MSPEQARMKYRKALILVDIQNDFLPGGALAVPRGDEVIAVANRLIASGDYDMVIASQDWHPPEHGSFARNAGVAPFTLGTLGGRPQVFWPDHCVWGTEGADFAKGLLPFEQISRMVERAAIVRKGFRPEADSYSAFKDDDGVKTELYYILHSNLFKMVDVVGLATDYCVKATAIDARGAGMIVNVIREGCRAVGMNPNDEEQAYADMVKAGCHVV